MRGDEIAAAALEWVGTPWKHHCSVKGVGTDCVQFIAEIARGAGAIPREYSPPKYRVDHAFHSDHSALLDEVRKFCVQVPVTDIIAGDVLCFRMGRCESHAGVALGTGEFVHAHIKYGVIVTPVVEYAGSLASVWRLKHE